MIRQIQDAVTTRFSSPSALIEASHPEPRLKVWLLAGIYACLMVACSTEADEAPDELIVGNRVQVSTIYVESSIVQQLERSYGRVETFALPEVAAEVAGNIKQIHVDVGDEVNEGDVLVSLDREPSETLYGAAQSEETALQVNVNHLQRELERRQPLLADSLVSESEIESLSSELESTRALLEAARFNRQEAERAVRNTEIISPVAGRVDARFVSEGSFVSAGDRVLRINPLSAYRVELSFPQSMRNALQAGQDVTLFPVDAPDEQVPGVVTRIRPSVTDGSRSLRVLVEFDNTSGWHPGITLVGEVLIATREQALQVPRLSVVQRPAGFVVYQAEGDQVYERVVTLGTQGSDWIEITDGLQPGDEIVTDGAAYLSDGALINRREADEILLLQERVS